MGRGKAPFARTVMRALVLTPRAFPFRRVTLRRFPYDVFYEFNAQRVVVVLVFHNSRDPASALTRLREH